MVGGLCPSRPLDENSTACWYFSEVSHGNPSKTRAHSGQFLPRSCFLYRVFVYWGEFLCIFARVIVCICFECCVGRMAATEMSWKWGRESSPGPKTRERAVTALQVQAWSRHVPLERTGPCTLLPLRLEAQAPPPWQHTPAAWRTCSRPRAHERASASARAQVLSRSGEGLHSRAGMAIFRALLWTLWRARLYLALLVAFAAWRPSQARFALRLLGRSLEVAWIYAPLLPWLIVCWAIDRITTSAPGHTWVDTWWDLCVRASRSEFGVF